MLVKNIQNRYVFLKNAYLCKVLPNCHVENTPMHLSFVYNIQKTLIVLRRIRYINPAGC